MKLRKKVANLSAVFLLGASGGFVGANLANRQGTANLVNTNTQTTINQTAMTNQTSTTEAVKSIQGAVVSVVNYTEQADSLSDIYSRIFGRQSDSTNQSETELDVYSEGSGVIYKTDGDVAYLVTNNHVVEGAAKLEIILSDGTRVDGELVGADTYSDLAVIKISSENVTTVGQFADSDSLTLGEIAIALGSPLGSEYANSVTQGIVSGLSRTVTLSNDQGETISTNAIQTDAAINQGNSGGPLINIQGQIIGINSSKISTSGSNVAVEGMGFAIPSNDVVAIINQLENSGRVVRPALGINMASLSQISASALNELNIPDEVTSGIVVVAVQEGMPADGQLQQYDVITHIDGQEVNTGSDLQSILYKHQLGDTLSLTIYRGKELLTVELVLNKTTQDLSQQ